jgi:hypothetical protein
MSTRFNGQWFDGNGDTITISSSADILSGTYSNGRGPFTGASADVGSPVIYMNFTDDAPFTGVLTVDERRILWSNHTIWQRS